MWSEFAGAIGRTNQEGKHDVGRYIIQENDSKLIYKEGPLVGAFEWDGEWFVAELFREGKPEGTLRLKQIRRGLESQFKAVGENVWDPAVIACASRKRKQPPSAQTILAATTPSPLAKTDLASTMPSPFAKVDPEKDGNVTKSKPQDVNDFLDGCCTPVAQPAVRTSASTGSMHIFAPSDTAQELPFVAKPSVITWNLSFSMVRVRAESRDLIEEHASDDAEEVGSGGNMVSFSTARRRNMSINTLSPEELREAVEHFEPQDVTEDKIFALFKSIDKRKTGVLNRTEFFSGLWGKQANELLIDLGVSDQHLSGTGHEVLQELFDLADLDCDGVLTFQEFMTALKHQVGREVD